MQVRSPRFSQLFRQVSKEWSLNQVIKWLQVEYSACLHGWSSSGSVFMSWCSITMWKQHRCCEVDIYLLQHSTILYVSQKIHMEHWNKFMMSTSLGHLPLKLQQTTSRTSRILARPRTVPSHTDYHIQLCYRSSLSRKRQSRKLKLSTTKCVQKTFHIILNQFKMFSTNKILNDIFMNLKFYKTLFCRGDANA